MRLILIYSFARFTLITIPLCVTSSNAGCTDFTIHKLYTDFLFKLFEYSQFVFKTVINQSPNP